MSPGQILRHSARLSFPQSKEIVECFSSFDMNYTYANKERKKKKNKQNKPRKVIKATNKHVKFSLENFAEKGYVILMSFLIEISWKKIFH